MYPAKTRQGQAIELSQPAAPYQSDRLACRHDLSKHTVWVAPFTGRQFPLFGPQDGQLP